MFGKFLDPKNDLAFKRIFGSERNKDILIHFVNDIFDLSKNPVEEVTFLETNQNPRIAAERSSSVDILCRDQKGNRFIVEMQVAYDSSFEKRAQYYAAKTYIEQRDRGIEYKDLKQVTFLAITNFTIFSQKQGYLSHHHILDTKTGERDLEDFSFSFLQLPQFNKTKDQLATTVDKWAYFFKYADETKEEDLDQIIGNDLILKRAYEELNRFSWSKGDLRTYDSVDMKSSADRTRYEDGVGDGKKEIAQNSLKQGLSIEMISKITGLSKEEIEALRALVPLTSS
jgi:predicted transposase/invertase (TIGR01784 family)